MLFFFHALKALNTQVNDKEWSFLLCGSFLASLYCSFDWNLINLQPPNELILYIVPIPITTMKKKLQSHSNMSSWIFIIYDGTVFNFIFGVLVLPWRLAFLMHNKFSLDYSLFTLLRKAWKLFYFSSNAIKLSLWVRIGIGVKELIELNNKFDSKL